MKQNFHMGIVDGEEMLAIEHESGMYWAFNEKGELYVSLDDENITNLRPITVLDIAPEDMREWMKYVTSTDSRVLDAGRNALDKNWHITYSDIRAQLTPTPPPKNEVGKVCVTEPLGLGAVVRAGNDLLRKSQFDNYVIDEHINVGEGLWLNKRTRNSYEYKHLINPILLSEGVEG